MFYWIVNVHANNGYGIIKQLYNEWVLLSFNMFNNVVFDQFSQNLFDLFRTKLFCVVFFFHIWYIVFQLFWFDKWKPTGQMKQRLTNFQLIWQSFNLLHLNSSKHNTCLFHVILLSWVAISRCDYYFFNLKFDIHEVEPTQITSLFFSHWNCVFPTPLFSSS